MRRFFPYGILALILLTGGPGRAQSPVAQSIVDSSHNLSSSGPGAVRALDEDRICIFCHTPHGARVEAPLWNRNDSTASYQPYDSPTLKASVGQPTGASKLCLSCHDGTVALGDLVSRDQPIAMSGATTMPGGSGLIGTDLRDDHPVSFNYFDSLGQLGGELTSPATWDEAIRLDATSQLQCTTCHDPHDNAWGNFLVISNQSAALCRNCHAIDGFDLSPHALEAATWNGAGVDPWPHTGETSVAANACMNCHRSHHAGGAEELLAFAEEEATCFACHNGNVATLNLAAEFEKRSIHPVALSRGEHEAGESPLDAAGHVECADCHNAHMARPAPAQAPFARGVNLGVSGLDASGVPVDSISHEYEMCYKCHGRETTGVMNAIERQAGSFNVVREFSSASPSYHPVTVAGRGGDVPSLLAPLTPGSLIYCTDCHGNDSPAGAGVPAGPHGSAHEYLLSAEYRTGDFVAESGTAYALCYGCHSRSSILDDESFDRHRQHIVDERTPCSVCHDPHGIDYTRGSATANAHLINFDLSVVDANPDAGRLEYQSLGVRSGNCTLRCHGYTHFESAY